MRRRRLFWLGICSLGGLAFLAVRLFCLTVFPDEVNEQAPVRWQDALRVKAELEHFRLVRTDDGRGRILYRNGLPLTGAWKPEVLSQHLRVRAHTELSSLVVDPVAGQVGLPDRWPDADRAAPEQGRSGLELAFDRVLRGQRPGYVATLRNSGPEDGQTVYSVEPVPGADIRTTMDPAWQRIARAALDQVKAPRAAVVLLDVPTNEAVAIVGRDEANPWSIPAVKAETPGSVFKLVTAALALESYQFRPTSRFFCTGAVQAQGVDMHCWTRHGNETLIQAIADSCDVTYASVGMRMGRKGMDWVVRRLHLNEPQLQEVDGETVLPGAESAVVFRHRGADNGLLANTAIGQEDVRLTPLQAANLARTIAAGGRMRPVRIVLDAEKSGVAVVRNYATPPDQRVISATTAYWLRQGMRAAVTRRNGTAHELAGAAVPVAVKTGTAELAGGRNVNAWMVGFFPAERPKFAFSVFVGNLPSPQAHRAVAEITGKLLNGYRQFQGTPVIG
jgi:cell division protein FtsI/penicillin-binding protein 2